MIEALADYLSQQGYNNIYCDFMPDEQTRPDCIGLYCWSHTVAELNDGSGIFFVQVQVRRSSYDEAKTVCKELFALLDSGLDEEQIQLTAERWCIARPRRGAVLLDRTVKSTTFYCEIALWGEN